MEFYNVVVKLTTMIYVSKGDKIFADDDFSRIGGVLDPFVVT